MFHPRAKAAALRRRPDRDRGGLSIFTAIITLVVVVFFGAIVDFERKLEARHDASIAAQEAARAGAGQVNRDRAYRSGTFVVDRPAALRAAENYLRTSGYAGSVTAVGTRSIRVRVTITKPTIFLSLIGISSVHSDAVAVADLISGVQGPDQP
ncbi:pilus assembly protein TadG-related protein [Actinomadura sp. SCN-SB]|uniref:pilus assembly protein TadG-related protein n=1 Tax=Actinomadura sp. SCN-SB TaxID=3373092 RepID=UPI003750C89E